MNAVQQRLWLRRQALLRQSADLRDSLESHGRGLAPLFGAADRAWAAASWLRAHPLIPAGVLALLIWRRPRRLLRWGRRAWAAWQLLQRARAAWGPRAAVLGSLFGR